MEDSIFAVIMAAIKAKIVPVVTKIKLYTSWNFIRTKLVTEIRNAFANLFDIRPRHKKDYYGMFGWLVSKRLAYAIVIVAGVLSAFYLVSLYSHYAAKDDADGVRTYPYNSIMLRFAKGQVHITGKSGYLAYAGEVADGTVTGQGTLYSPQGVPVYQGEFAENEYEGNGISYYDNGNICYQGEFRDNCYEGIGKLYRENGSLEYEGGFLKGKKEGSGTLYNDGNNRVYTGEFSQDELVYSALLGKTAQEISEAYSGRRILYEGPGTFAVIMPEIDALYMGSSPEEALDDSIVVDTVYVMRSSFMFGGRTYTTISEISQIFEEAVYEGNAEATLAETVIINWMGQREHILHGNIEMEAETIYTDYYRVSDYDKDYYLYLYTFQKDGLLYTFICKDKDAGFAFYSIVRDGGDG